MSSNSVQAVFHGLSYNSVCITALHTQGDQHSFLSGTCSPRETNEIRLLRFDESTSDVRQSVFKHNEEVHSVVCSPLHPGIFFTTHQSKQQIYGATLWQLPDEGKEASKDGGLVRLLDLPAHKKKTGLVWRNSEEGFSDHVMTFDSENLRLWRLQPGHTSLADDNASISGPVAGTTAGCFDPHQSDGAVFLTVGERAIRVWDTRSFQKEVQTIARAHDDIIRDVDFNPNKLHHVATVSNDRTAKLWDLRRPLKPLRFSALTRIGFAPCASIPSTISFFSPRELWGE